MSYLMPLAEFDRARIFAPLRASQGARQIPTSRIDNFPLLLLGYLGYTHAVSSRTYDGSEYNVNPGRYTHL